MTRRIQVIIIHKQDTDGDVRKIVRQKYGEIASQVTAQGEASCCGSSSPQESGCCGKDETGTLSQVAQLYETPDVNDLPTDVTNLSLGCGDPVTLASLEPGQVVLDLGSGGGIDCFLAAKRVGERGRVIGVDMTPAMLDKARANKAKLGADNVEFRLGEIEHLPVENEVVDVVISNCVINLSPDKPQVFREAFRVLKPGGRLAVSDIVTDGPLPDEIKNDLSAWAGCVAGAWEAKDYIAAIEDAGFVQVELTPVYMSKEMIAEAVDQLDLSDKVNLDEDSVQQTIYSAKVKAYKPSQ
jgi:arsenite methyltransferase